MGPLEIILLSLLGVIVLLFAVCAVRAIMIKKTPAVKTPAISWTDAEAELYANRLCEMIKIPTVSKKQGEEYPEFTRLQDRMRELFPLTFQKSEWHELDGNILLRIPGTSPEKGGVLLMGHQDVVPATQKEWTVDPYAGIIKDGCVWGRGSMDCKSTLSCEFSAVEELLNDGFEPKEDLWLFSSRNEENSGGGSQLAAKYLKENGYKINIVLDEGGAVIDGVFPGLKMPCSAIGLVEKGFCDIKFIAAGSGGHASTPPKNTPIARLAGFVNEIEKKNIFKEKMLTPIPEMFRELAPYLPFYFRFTLGNLWLFKPLITAALPLFSPMARAFVATTAAFTMSGGSDATNVLPDEAYVVANVRPSVHQNADESIAALKKIADKYDLSMEILLKRDASKTSSPDSDEFNFLKKCLNEALPDTVVTPYMMAGGTDSRQFEIVCDNVLRFTPTRLTAQQLAAMHAANENINISALAEGVKFYRYYLEQLNAR